MKLIAVTCLFTFAAASILDGLNLGCIDECTPMNIAVVSIISTPCPFGQLCVPSGCSHKCLSLSGLLKKRFECPLYKCIPCPNGYEKDENGCQICTCKVERQVQCSNVMCMMFCINGFATGPDGCPICSCA